VVVIVWERGMGAGWGRKKKTFFFSTKNSQFGQEMVGPDTAGSTLVDEKNFSP